MPSRLLIGLLILSSTWVAAADGALPEPALRLVAATATAAGGDAGIAVANILSDKAGTISLWLRLRDDKADGPPAWRPILTLLAADGKTPVSSVGILGRSIRWKVESRSGKDQELYCDSALTWLRGDWHQVAIQWDASGWTRLVIDGQPQVNGYTYRPVTMMAEGAGLADPPAKLLLGRGPTAKNGKFEVIDADIEDVRIWSAPLASRQLAGVFRARVPVDLVCERRFLAAGRPERVQVDCWPGGTLPAMESAGVVPGPLPFNATLAIEDESGARLAERSWTGELSGLRSLVADLPAAKPGPCRAVCTWDSAGIRGRMSWQLLVHQMQGSNPDAGELRLGPPVVDIDCVRQEPTYADPTSVVSATLSYRETSSALKGQRFSYAVELPETLAQGQPLAVDITWPDDRPRSMGMYLYRESSTLTHRDRIGGGVHGGAEYAESGRLQTTRYFIYPWRTRYLFEIRSLVAGMPAALAHLSVRPVLGRLPRLDIPGASAGGRRLGHFDEDQSWEIPLALDSPDDGQRPLRMVNALMDILDHTGQDLITNAVLRYGGTLYDLPGRRSSNGAFNEIPGSSDLLLDAAAERGKSVVVSLNFLAIPEDVLRPDQQGERTADGFYLLGPDGQRLRSFNGLAAGSPLSAEWRRRWFAHLDEILRRFGRHPAFAGLDIYRNGWRLNGLENGFDATTSLAFARDAGIGLPGGNDATACAARAELLRGTHRSAWMAWCAARNTALLAEMAARLRAVRPDAKLRVLVLAHDERDGIGGSAGLAGSLYDDGYDIAGIRAIPGAVLAPQQSPTSDRWGLHFRGSRSGMDEQLYDLRLQSVLRGDVTGVTFYRYFETRGTSQDDARYKNMFQNADAKPHGPWFRKSLAFQLAAYDANEVLFGGQTLGSSGREDEVRRFARAYRAIPSGAFADVAGSRDPLIVRSLSRAGESWLYAVNISPALATATVTLPACEDLAVHGDPAAVGRRAGGLDLRLEPFDLVVCRWRGSAQGVAIAEGPRVDDAAAVAAAGRRIAAYAAGVDRLAAAGAPAESQQALRRQLEAAMREGRMAEVDRLLGSGAVADLARVLVPAEKGWLRRRAEMAARGHYAVDCGSDDFYLAGDGRLFFPDQPWSAGGYGYDGKHSSAQHPIAEALQGTEDPALFLTEAYHVSAYRFAVPPGSYTVRVYNRIGYGPDAVPGKVVMNLRLAGKQVWSKMDLFKAIGGDARRVLVSEWRDIRVDTGVLDLELSSHSGKGGWINAIEVIPQ